MRCQSKYVSRVVSTHINIEISTKLYKTIKTSWKGTSRSLILILVRSNIRFDNLKKKKNTSLEKKQITTTKKALAFQARPQRIKGGGTGNHS